MTVAVIGVIVAPLFTDEVPWWMSISMAIGVFLIWVFHERID
jgi:hypothetical protein